MNGYPYSRVHLPLDSAAVLASQANMAKYLQLEAAMPAAKIAFNPMRITDSTLRQEVRHAINRRIDFAGYLMELLRESAVTAEPILRHMEYQFPGSGFSDCDDQFMVGGKLHVAPDINGEGRRMVRIPKGVWEDEEGRRYKGPQVAQIPCPGYRAVILTLSGK